MFSQYFFYDNVNQFKFNLEILHFFIRRNEEWDNSLKWQNQYCTLYCMAYILWKLFYRIRSNDAKQETRKKKKKLIEREGEVVKFMQRRILWSCPNYAALCFFLFFLSDHFDEKILEMLSNAINYNTDKQILNYSRKLMSHLLKI